MANLKLFNEDLRVGDTFSIEEIIVMEHHHCKKTLNDLCYAYGFKSVNDLRYFCTRVIRLINITEQEEKAMLQRYDSDEEEPLKNIVNRVIKVKDR